MSCRARHMKRKRDTDIIYLYIYIYNCPLKGIGVRDIIIILGDFSFFLRFSSGCGSKFQAEVAYLEVGSSDLEQIHEKKWSPACTG